MNSCFESVVLRTQGGDGGRQYSPMPAWLTIFLFIYTEEISSIICAGSDVRMRLLFSLVHEKNDGGLGLI